MFGRGHHARFFYDKTWREMWIAPHQTSHQIWIGGQNVMDMEDQTTKVSRDVPDAESAEEQGKVLLFGSDGWTDRREKMIASMEQCLAELKAGRDISAALAWFDSETNLFRFNFDVGNFHDQITLLGMIDVLKALLNENVRNG